MGAEAKGALLEGAFCGRADFQQLIRDALAQAAQEGWREMVWFDLNYVDWPLGERCVQASLQAWSATGRKLTIVAKRFDAVAAGHHRFVAWRRQWSHIVEARAVSGASDEEFPSLILSPQWAMQRLHFASCKGVASGVWVCGSWSKSGWRSARRLLLRRL
jgi:hypothetical protein